MKIFEYLVYTFEKHFLTRPCLAKPSAPSDLCREASASGGQSEGL